MQIFVRIDDITPDMDWESFYKFKEMLDKYQIKPLIGVVPDSQDEKLTCSARKEDFWQYILQLKKEGFSIAQHGYRHLYTTKKGGLFPLNHFSEFAGLSYEEQLQKLKAGRDILKNHGIETNIFMAPGHSYDVNTLKALDALGFSYVTDGFAKSLYQRNNLTFIPIAAQRSKCMDGKNEITTLVYHINNMTEADKKRYDVELSRLQGMLPYSEIMKLPTINCTLFGRIKERIMAIVKHAMIALRQKGSSHE